MLGHAREIIAIIWLTLGAVWGITALSLKPRVRGASYLSRLLELSLLVPAACLLFLERPPLGPLDARWLPASALDVGLGMSLAACGVAFAILARIYLGRNWSATATIKHDHDLISQGPYRLVRHPIYSGILFAAVGTAITFGELRALFALPLLLLAFWLKAGTEERLLRGEFGERYLAYCREVRSAIIPFVL